MKKTLSVLLVMAGLMSAMAMSAKGKDNPYFEKGYRGNVELSLGGGVGGFFEPALTTTHGYVFCKGLFAGLGTGIGLRYDGEGFANIPFYADVRYSPLRNRISPFVDMKFGGAYDSVFESVGLYASPAVGIDIGIWSVFIKYTYRGMRSGVSINLPGDTFLDGMLNMTFKTHVISLGAAISF